MKTKTNHGAEIDISPTPPEVQDKCCVGGCHQQVTHAVVHMEDVATRNVKHLRLCGYHYGYIDELSHTIDGKTFHFFRAKR